jgi:hypothetical protein
MMYYKQYFRSAKIGFKHGYYWEALQCLIGGIISWVVGADVNE